MGTKVLAKNAGKNTEKKMSKSGMIKFLQDNFDKLENEPLTDKIVEYLAKCDEDSRSVSSDDLAQLVTAVNLALAPEAENQVIKPVKKKAKTEEKPAGTSETPADGKKADAKDDKKPSKPAVKKPASKKSKKDEEKPEQTQTPPEPPKKPEVEDANKIIPLAKSFPETFANESGTYKAEMTIENIPDLLKAITEKKADIVIANYWNKRALKQFDYDQLGILKKRPTEFPNDLDLLKVVYISNDSRFLYALSLYTEMIWCFESAEFKIYDGLRFSSGIEFNLYTKEE